MSTKDLAPNKTPSRGSDVVMEIPLDSIVPSPLNPRKLFDEERLGSLADSIKTHGVLEPILVRENLPGTYEIIGGERRWRASRIAEMSTIPAIVYANVEDRHLLELSLIENLCRADINAIEEAQGYRQLADLGMKQEEIAERVNRSQPSIANAMRLLKLPDKIQQWIATGKLTPSHGIVLLKYEAFPDLMNELAQAAAARGLTTQVFNQPFNALTQFLSSSSSYRRVGNYDCQFDWKKVCKSCPFNAFVPGRYENDGYCLKPSHFDDLQREAHEARSQKAVESLAKAKESANKKVAAAVEAAATSAEESGLPAGVIDLSKLQHDQYEQFYSDRPEGCTNECPCFVIGSRNGRVNECCLDPARLRALKSKQTKEKKKDLRTELDEDLGEVAESWAWENPRLLYVLARTALSGMTVAEQRATAKGLPDGPLKEFLTSTTFSHGFRKDLDLLQRSEVQQVVAAAIECMVRKEIKNSVDYSRRDTPIMDFLLCKPEAPVQDDQEVEPEASIEEETVEEPEAVVETVEPAAPVESTGEEGWEESLWCEQCKSYPCACPRTSAVEAAMKAAVEADRPVRYRNKRNPDRLFTLTEQSEGGVAILQADGSGMEMEITAVDLANLYEAVPE